MGRFYRCEPLLEKALETLMFGPFSFKWLFHVEYAIDRLCSRIILLRSTVCINIVNFDILEEIHDYFKSDFIFIAIND